MAVPTPIAHWVLDESATPCIDEIAGYEGDITLTGGGAFAGGLGFTGRGNGNTALKSNYLGDGYRLTYDRTATPGLYALIKDSAGTVSFWARTSDDAETATGDPNPAFTMFIDDLTTTNPLAIGLYFEGAISGSNYIPSVEYTDQAFIGGFVEFGWDNLDAWVDEWILWSLVWTSTEVSFYVNGQLANSGTRTTPAGTLDPTSVNNFITLGGAEEINETLGSSGGSFQDFKIWDVALTADQLLELFSGGPSDCKRTIPLRQLRTFWYDVERTLPCKASIQRESIAGFETFATNVPVSIELTGTRQELDSSDNYITIQNWLVTMSGRVSLPNPGAFSTVRFLVAGLILESYDFYQSPDDIQTVIECKKI